jgi:hypothetical protein
MRTRVCILVGAVAAGLTFWCTALGTADAREDLPRVTLDLKDTPLEDALKLLFHGTPYTFELDPEFNPRVTVNVPDATWDDALQALVRANDLSYTKSGNVYHFSGRASGRKTGKPEEPSLSEESAPKGRSPDTGPPSARYAVVYTHQVEHGPLEIRWKELLSAEYVGVVGSSGDTAQSARHKLTSAHPPRSVYTVLSPSAYWGSESLRYLPSPDGRWLYVWETRYAEDGWRPLGATLSVVRLPEGEVVKVAEPKEGVPLPRWEDSRHLVLETDTGSSVFDVAERKLTGPLPSWAPKASTGSSDEGERRWQTWLAGYWAMRYPAATKCLHAALRSLRGELGVESHLRERAEPPEMLTIRPSGIVRFQSRYGEELLYPSVACSPDGQWIARAWVFSTPPFKKRNEQGKWVSRQGAQARIDVYNLPRRKLAWSTSMVWPVYEAPEGSRLPTYNPQYLEPRFSDLRWGGKSRFLSYTACSLPRPWGVPMEVRYLWERDLRVYWEWEGQERETPTTAVVVVDGGKAWNSPGALGEAVFDWTYLYIPDASSAFVIPVWEESQLSPPGGPVGE